MKTINVEREGIPAADDSLEAQLRELARLIGGLLAREHLSRRAIAEKQRKAEDGHQIVREEKV